jgi:hypothetical protein
MSQTESKKEYMNPQTITNRANSSHFSHSDAHKGEASRETVTKAAAGPALKNASAKEEKEPKQKKTSTAAKSVAPATAAAPAAQSAQPSTAKETTFKLESAHAHEVQLAGCFTDWKKSAVKMVKGGGGVWHAKVNLKPGTYHYRFIVDGNWQDDPTHNDRVPNPYGSSDMVLKVA